MASGVSVAVTVRVEGRSGQVVVSRDGYVGEPGCQLLVEEVQRQWLEEKGSGLKTGLPGVPVQASIVLNRAAAEELCRVLQWVCGSSAASVGTSTRSGAVG